MSRKVFVGNLSFETTNQDLEALFASIGTCQSATVVMDRDTGRSRGFGFVEMSSPGEAEKAIGELNGCEMRGRQIRVSEANERSSSGGGRGSRR